MTPPSPEEHLEFDEIGRQIGESTTPHPIPLTDVIGLYLLCLGLMITWGIICIFSKIDLRIFIIVMQGGLILLPTLYFVQKNRRSFRQTLHLKQISAPVFILTLLLIVPTRICSSLITSMVQIVFPIPEQHMDSLKFMYSELLFPSNATELALIVIGTVIMAAVCEEIMFRGFILTAFKERIHIWGAIIITSLGFAIYHFDPWGLPEYAVIGIFFGWLVVRTGSIFPAMIAHASFNFLGIIILPRIYKVEKVDEFLDISFPPYVYPVAFALVVLFFYILIRCTEKKAHVNGVGIP